MARLSTHVLDTARGRPATGVGVTLHRLDADGGRVLVTRTVTNGDGRTDAPLLAEAAFRPGTYEIAFEVGAYFTGTGEAPPDPPFLDVVPVRVTLAAGAKGYHIPLLVSPWSYSTYRGS